MFKFEELKTIHLEITNNCQAKCPMCSRNFHSGLPNPLLKLNGWTLSDFKKIMSVEVLNTIKFIYFCGNFGDPILNNDLIKMCEYVTSINPNLTVSIHTNGGARKPSWWKELFHALPKNHNIHFAIDGLEDTHHLYRVGTTYNDVIQNASSFINEGGIAEWTFLKFKHNEHQVAECRSIAKSLGFKKFALKNSSRFLGDPKFKVLDKNGNITHFIEPPSESSLSLITTDVINSYKQLVQEADIHCIVKEKKEIYIDAHKKLMPCCWVSSIPSTYHEPIGPIPEFLDKEMKEQYLNLIKDLKGEKLLDARIGIRKIIETDEWQNVWKKYWNDEKMITCARICGKFKEVTISQPNDQFIETDFY
jgi:MoaA/NifB/PqqE/SkfB family radical SAM enzyme